MAMAIPMSAAEHEELFRSLGLWDFAHLDVTPAGDALRLDLIRPLITTYDPYQQRSIVAGSPVHVSRAALATALALPLAPSPMQQAHVEALMQKEGAARALEDLILNHMVFMEHGALLPDEVVLALKRVNACRPQLVDWVGLAWSLLLRDLKEASTSGKCHYYYHLQLLIKQQRPELFHGTEAHAEGEEGNADTEEAGKKRKMQIGDHLNQFIKGHEDFLAKASNYTLCAPSIPMAKEASNYPIANDQMQGYGAAATGGEEVVRGRWSVEEDSLLRELVGQHGTRNWALIAMKMGSRCSKQCRERWINILDPSVKRDVPWTEEEELKLVKGHMKFGSKWSLIANVIPGRPENMIKNHWNTNLRKLKRKASLGRISDDSDELGGTKRAKVSIFQKYLKSTMMAPPRVEEPYVKEIPMFAGFSTEDLDQMLWD